MSGRRRAIDLTPPARRDLTSILGYTERVWGEHQANAYERRLMETMERLTLHPFLGAPRNDLGIGLRARAAGRHRIYYTLTDDLVVVRRILHQSIDPHGQLGDDE